MFSWALGVMHLCSCPKALLGLVFVSFHKAVTDGAIEVKLKIQTSVISGGQELNINLSG